MEDVLVKIIRALSGRGLAWLLMITLPLTAIQAQMPLDSLRLLAEDADDWDIRKTALIEVTEYYQMRNHDSVRHYLAVLEDRGRENNDPEAIVNAKLTDGKVQHGMARMQEARSLYHQALRIAELRDLPVEKGEVYLNLGLSHARGFQMDSAFFYLQEAEKNFRENDREGELWRCYSGYAKVHIERGDYPAVDQSYRQAVELMPADEPSSNRGFILYNVFAYAAQYRRFELLSEVRVLWNEYKGAQRFDQETLERPEHIALYSMLAGNNINMEEIISEAIVHYQTLDRPYRLASFYHDLGEFFYANDKLEESTYAYSQSDSIYASLGYSSYLVGIRKRLAELYQRAGNYSQALAYTKAGYWVLDSLRREDSERNLRQFQVQYETEKKERELRINQLELTQKTQERNLWIGSSFVLALLGLFVYSVLRRQLRQRELITTQEAALQEQRIQQLEQEKTLLAFSSMIEGQELERQRIARDLHDGMGGLLTTIKAHYNTIVSQFADQHAALNIAPLTGELIDRACTEVRRISQNMMPAALLYSGLTGALEDLAGQVRTNGLECTLEIVGDIDRIDETRAIALYRVMQEAVNNILKHARANHVLLQVMIHREIVNATIEDDGVGFVVAEGLQEKSLGLNTMDSRVRYLKGHCDIDSVVGEGTDISLQFPLT